MSRVEFNSLQLPMCYKEDGCVAVDDDKNGWNEEEHESDDDDAFVVIVIGLAVEQTVRVHGELRVRQNQDHVNCE